MASTTPNSNTAPKPEITERLDRWQQRLLRPTELVLPTDYPRPVPLKVVEASHTIALPDSACLALLQLSLSPAHGDPLTTAPAEPASPFHILLAAFAVLMNRYTSEEDIVVGSSSDSGNPLVLRLAVRPEDTFLQVIDMVQRVEKDAIADEVPFNLLLSSLTGGNQPTGQNAPSFFRARFFNQTDTTSATLAQTVSANTDLTVFITQQSTASLRRLLPSVQITMSYNQVLFSPTRIHHICDQLIQVLEGSARVAQALEAHRTNPTLPLPSDTAVGVINLVTPRCWEVIPDPRGDLHWDEWPGSITSIFAQNAQQFPDRRCVVENVLVNNTQSVERSFTYKQVYDTTHLLAVHLLRTGIQREDVVVIYAYRGVDLAIAIMGVLMAGATYSVIDPAYPAERQNIYLSVAQPRGLVVLKHAGELAASVRQYITDELTIVSEVPALEIRTDGHLLGGADASGDCMDPSRGLSDAELAAAGLPSVPVFLGPDSIGTLSFTSGSTGIPKGVRGRHYSLTHFYPWMRKQFNLSDQDRFTMLSGIAHDPIQRDVFTPFFLGAELHIPTSEDIGIPGQLASWMAEHRITVTHLTPAMGQLLSTNATCPIPSLANAFFVGDLLTKRSCHRLQHLAENVTVVNMFGTTETQRAVSYFAIPSRAQKPSFLSAVKDVIPAGWGMRSVQLLVVNRFNSAPGSTQLPTMCGVGEIGEIYVRSGGLSEGYLKLDGITSEKFVSNWFNPKLRGENLQARDYLPEGASPWPHYYRGVRDRLYRSGDLGRYLPDGSVECVGRMDDQVKIRGFRIELGEIDNHLSQFPRIRANVTLVRRDKNEEKTLVTYFVPGPVESFSHAPGEAPAADAVANDEADRRNNYANLIADIRAYLKHKLPSYSIPSVFVPLNRLPLTPNGKVDKAALPFPDTALFADKSSRQHRRQGSVAENESEEAETARQLDGYTQTECTLNGIWRQVLDLNTVVPLHANFFDLGGHSILATRMIFQVRKTFCVDVPLGLVFQQPTIHGMGAEIDRITSADLNIAVSAQPMKGATGAQAASGGLASVSLSAAAAPAEQSAAYSTDFDALVDQLPPPLAFTKATGVSETFVFPERVQSGDAPVFFLTGATGFLGAFILAHLLKRFPSATVYCLTRGSSPEHAFERVKKSSADHLVWQDQWDTLIPKVDGASASETNLRWTAGYGSQQVRAIVGDLALPHLGIADDEWQALAKIVDVIVHNGALVHWVYPYEKLRAPNVLGTLAAIELATTNHLKPLHFVSSTSVLDTDHYVQLGEFKEEETFATSESASSTTPSTPTTPTSTRTRQVTSAQPAPGSSVLESDDLEGSRYELRSGYGQSKWVAEKLLLQARARGYPCTIIRPGYIVGASQTGVTNTDDFLWRLVKGCVQLGEVPIMNNTVNMCPVDHVAEVVVQAASQPRALGLGVFHVDNPTRFRYNDFFDQLRVYGFAVDPVAYIPWRNHLMDVTLKSTDNALYPLLHFVLDDLPTSTRSPALDMSHTRTLCRAGGVQCPAMRSLIGLYLAYLVKIGFLTPPTLYNPDDPTANLVGLIVDGADTDCDVADINAELSIPPPEAGKSDDAILNRPHRLPKLWSSTGIRSFHRSLSTETTTSLPQPTSEEIRIPAVVRYNEKLLQAKDAGKPDEMWYHYQKAKREGIPFNGHSYAILLSGLCQLRQPGDLVTRIINVYNEAQDKGFTQSLFTHTDIIRALCQRDQRIAEELQNLSRKTRMAPEVRELQQQRLEAERNFEVAFSIYDFAKDQRVFIDAYTCDMLIRAGVDRGDPHRALELYQHMLDNMISVTPYTHGYVLRALAAIGDDRQSQKVHEIMELYLRLFERQGWATKGIRAPLSVISEYINALIKAEGFDLAFVLSEIQRTTDRLQVPPTVPMYNLVVSHYVKLGQLDAAEALVTRMSQQEFSPEISLSQATYNIMVQAYLNQPHYAKALAYFRRAERAGFTLRVQYYNRLLRLALEEEKEEGGAGSSAPQVVIELLTSMWEKKIDPDMTVFRDLFSYALKYQRNTGGSNGPSSHSDAPADADVDPTPETMLRTLMRAYNTNDKAFPERLEAAGSNLVVKILHQMAPNDLLLHIQAYRALRRRRLYNHPPTARIMARAYLKTRSQVHEALRQLGPGPMARYYGCILQCAEAHEGQSLRTLMKAIFEDVISLELANIGKYLTIANIHLLRTNRQIVWDEANPQVFEFQSIAGPGTATTSSDSNSTNLQPSAQSPSPSTPQDAVTPPAEVIISKPPLPIASSFQWNDQSVKYSVEMIVAHKRVAFGEMQLLYHKMMRLRLILTPAALQAYLQELILRKQARMAKQVLETAKASLSRVDNDVAVRQFQEIIDSSTVLLYLQLRQINEALNRYKQAKQKGRSLSATANAKLVARLPDSAETVVIGMDMLADMHDRGVPVSVYFFNALMEKHVRARHNLPMVPNLFHQMTTKRVNPSLRTFDTVIMALLWQGDIPEALSFLDRYRQALRQNWNHPWQRNLFYNATTEQIYRQNLVRPYERLLQFFIEDAQNKSGGLQIYHYLVQDHIPLQPSTYLLLMKLHAQLAPMDPDAMRSLFNALETDTQLPNPSVEHYNILLMAFSQGEDQGNTDNVVEWFSKMTANQITPNSRTYRILHETFRNAGNEQEAQAAETMAKKLESSALRVAAITTKRLEAAKLKAFATTAPSNPYNKS
ncbi:large subunit of alpha-aminoadipate reductase [Dimargaris cristalligena]|nr:large subunit of alpha-aminoadipate reductase [Dimargaris cristalligena]